MAMRKPGAGKAASQKAARAAHNGSLIVTVPAGARNAVNLSAGQETRIAVEGERLILEPSAPTRRRPKYSLKELLEQCHPDAPMGDEERRWLYAPAVGRELWQVAAD